MNNEDIKYLDYEGLIEYHNNITGKIFIPTIDYIPNETTLTYIVNNKTFKFDIGDFVRVINSTKESGFTFYQLYDITEQNKAIWGSYSEKTPPTYVSPSAKNLTYDGNPLELLNPGSTSEGTFQYSLLTTNRRSATDSLSWSTNIPTATDANNYTVYWRLIGDESHADILPTAISVEIEKVTPVYTNPTSNNLVYNELSQELITPGTTNFGTFQYSFDEINWSNEIPERINAGTYTVYYRILGDDNINTTETENLSITISPKEIDNPGIVLSQNTYIYDGEECEPSVTLYDNQTEIPATEYTVSYQNNINVGTAEVIITDNSDGNYIVSGNTTFTINKANGRIDTLPTNKEVVYNSEPQVLANAGLGTGVMYYSLDEHDNFSTTIPSLTNAGTYTLYFYAAESANYLQSATQNITVTISKANPSYTAPQGKDNLIYSGESLELLIEGSSSDGIIKYSDDEGETWTTDIPEGTNAITYYPQWKVFGDSNHNDSTPTIITVSIAKVTPTVTAPTIVSNLAYTGEAQNLLNNDGSTNFGTLQYSSDNETFSTTIPTGTNAGSYDIWYRVQGDSNINDVPSVKLTNSIAKVDACYVAPTAVTGLVYDESSHALLNAGSSTCGTIQYSADGTNWSSNIPEGTNAGDYTSYWKVIGDSNHIDKPSASIITNIDKAAGEIYVDPTPITGLVYNDAALSLITAGSGTGTMQYKVDSGSWESTIPTMINAGTYTIYYKAIESANYYATDGTDYITNNIAKITLTITSPVPRVLTYNTSSLALVIAGDISPEWAKTYVSMKYSLNGTTWSTNVPEAINYGSYTVYYKVDGNSNINDVPSAYVACSIAEKRVSVPTIIPDSTYNYVYSGTAKTPTVVVKDGDVVVDPSEYTVTYLNNINAGTATIVISDNEGGNYNITGTQDFTISKAPGYVNPKPQANNLTYNESSQVLIDTTNVLSSGTMMYRLGSSGDFSTTVPSATNADTYTVYFYSAESNNYLQSTPTESVNITIAEKAIVIPTPTGYSAQYDENAHTATFGSATGASITKYRYSTDNSTWTESASNPSLTNVGTLYTQAYYTAGTNYTESGWSSSATISISRNTSASASEITGLIYNGTTESNGSAQTGVSGSYVSWSGTTSATNAGSYTAYSTPTSNYAWSDGTYALKIISWSIARRGQTAPVLNGASAVFHSTATASVKTAGTVYGGTATAPGTLTWSNQSRTAVGSQIATAYYAATATNFSASPTSTQVTVQVTQASDASVSVTLSGTLTHNGSAQTLATATSHGCTYYLALGSNGTSAPSSGWTNGSLTATNAGTYYIWYKGTKDGNHSNDVGATYKGSVVINQQGGWVTASATNRTYSGSGQVVGSVSSASGTYYLGFGGSTTSGPSSWGSANSSISATNAGTYYIWAKCDASTNYTAVGAKYIGTATIGKSNQNAPTASGSTTTYPTAATASASGGGGQGSIQWESALSQTSVGSHTTRARWLGNANYNASGWSNYVTVTMNKANQNAPTATGASVTYGNTATASASGGGGQGSIEWSNGNTLTGNAGSSKTTQARWSGNGNYNASEWSNSVTLAITKANQAAPTATGATVELGNTATATASGGGGQGSIEWSNGNTRTAAGSQTTKARWSGNSNYNASPWSNEVTLKVNEETRLVVTYNVTSTSSPTELWRGSGSTNYYTTAMEIDGVVQSSVIKEYTFSTTGEHTVKYTLSLSTKINEWMFQGCHDIISVKIPNSVTKIRYDAFDGCTGLTSVTIPNSVTTIEERVFYHCRGLTSITIPSSVTSIGTSCFNYCDVLKNITCNATTAPSINSDTFRGIYSYNGTLTVPTGSTGYDVWMGTGDYYLGQYNWTIQYK